jgi:vacuolar-type H+-ATPase subunit E/Vma4
MAYEELLKSVEESAEERERELQKKAAAAIDDIRARAKLRASAIQQASVSEAKKSVETERNKLLFLTKAENKELLTKAREAVFEKAFLEAEDRLSTLRLDPKYPVIFEKLLREATGTLENEGISVHIDKQDEPLCKTVLDAMNLKCEIRPDLQTRGGVAVSSSGNAVMITNTVESRLLRVRESRRQDIHAILAG